MGQLSKGSPIDAKDSLPYSGRGRYYMVARTHSSYSRRRRSGGQALLESVFVILPTMAIIVAFFDFGMMWYRWSSMQNAVREGVRYAITFRTMTGLGQLDSIRTVVQRNSMGLVRLTDNPQTIFVKFYPKSNPNAEITTGGNVPGNIVEVSIQNISFNRMIPLSGSFSSLYAPFYRSNAPFNLKVYAYDIMGGFPAGVSSVTP